MQQIKSFVDTKIIYLYDLPVKEYTSTKLAKFIYAETGYHLEIMPQVTRDLAKPFYSARIKIENQEKFDLVLSKLRYFTFEGHPCRGLPYQEFLKGANIQKLVEHNLFVRKLPKDIFSDGLAKKFDDFGKIISCKVSIDEQYNSKGYGFITFESASSVEKALNSSQSQLEMIGVKYAPRGKNEFKRVFNNIFVKNLPEDWTEQQIREAFSVFGNITSIKNQANNIGQYAFICFGSTDVEDREYGFIAGRNAVQEMNNKEINGKQIYCSPALKKEERLKDIMQESLKYKNSKRRLNLFVKGFAPTTSEEDLKPLFEVFGPIESLRIIHPEDSTKPYAFVCFYTPDAASQAKNAKIEINGNQPLTIKLYELKEQRDLLKEAAEDLKGWQQYQSELAPQNEYKNIEQITSVIQMLMATMQKQGQNNQGMLGYQQNRAHSQPHYNGQYQNQNNNQGGYRGNNNYQGNQNRQNQAGQNNYGNRNQQQSQPRPQPMPLVQQIPIPAPMPQAPQAYTQQVQFIPSQDPMAQELYSKTLPIYAAITEINPSYKQVVGSTIFEFVTKLAGQQYAPKITGMLIDLPIVEIQRYATNFDLFAQRIQQALQLLTQQSIAQQ